MDDTPENDQDRRAPDTEEARERYRRYHNIVAAFGKRALVENDLDAVLQAATEEVSRGIRVELVKVLEHRTAPDDFLVRAGVGWQDGVVGRATLPNGMTSPPGRAFLTGEPVYIDDLDADEAFETSDLLARHDVVSVVNVPIKTDEFTWGVLEVDSDKKRHFNDDDCEFLAGFAALLASAIQAKQTRASEMAHALEREVLLKEREVLFRELQHRVSNNFQTLLGLLEIESHRTGDPGARAGIEKIINRLDFIVRSHEQLSLQQVEKDISLGGYLAGLVANLNAPENIRIAKAIDDMTVPLRTAVHLGLAVNELVTNSLKHAFGAAGGTISITVTPDVERKRGRLLVADNGHGLGPSRPGSSGTWLVDSLVQQIGGTVTRTGEVGQGTTVTVEFPLAP